MDENYSGISDNSLNSLKLGKTVFSPFDPDSEININPSDSIGVGPKKVWSRFPVDPTYQSTDQTSMARTRDDGGISGSGSLIEVDLCINGEPTKLLVYGKVVE